MELMNSDSCYPFEDVMELLVDACANLLKMLLRAVEVEDTEHPVILCVSLRMKNLALRAALIGSVDCSRLMNLWTMRKCWLKCAKAWYVRWGLLVNLISTTFSHHGTLWA